MLALLATFQIAAFQIAAAGAMPTRSPSPDDSARIERRVRDVQFRYFMDWRQVWEQARVDMYWNRKQAIDSARSTGQRPPPSEALGLAGDTVLPYCPWLGHAIAARSWPTTMYECPGWLNPAAPEPANEQRGIDAALPGAARDTVRARRVSVLRLLDSAARLLPGDAWLAGQRVRMHLDQGEPDQAFGAATECRAAAWWCGMLRGYVRFSSHEVLAAEAAFDSAERGMPADTLCRWNDLSALLADAPRLEYRAMSCTEKATVNERIWWLADPLYVERGNPRRTEDAARRVLAALRAGNDVDEREDWRDDYAGPAMWELVERYGWPTTMWWAPPGPFHNALPGWGRFDIHAMYLGIAFWPPEVAPEPTSLVPRAGPPGGFTLSVTDSVEMKLIRPVRPYPLYQVPQFHMVPSWTAILDPLHAVSSDWDIAAHRTGQGAATADWWPPEFYRRYEGPLVQLPDQVAFVRRSSSAMLAAATEWNAPYIGLAMPSPAVFALVTSGGPAETPQIVRGRVVAGTPHAILAPVERRPLLLGLELVPLNDTGPAGRTRFAIDPPPRLTPRDSVTLAVSDVILARASPGSAPAPSLQRALDNMYGTAAVEDPERIALYWEVYGQGDRDTVDVTLRIVRADSAGRLARLAASIGIGQVGPDSMTIRWREPRRGDAPPATDSGVTIRSRSLVVDVSALQPGDYTVTVRLDRRGVSTVSRDRELSITRTRPGGRGKPGMPVPRQPRSPGRPDG